ncbi:MAG: Lrp/AsnC family transcriptional regulator [Deltaproteobacteria bacterium]|nr:Lrp/AsnC family transcriptional regulator [Deltaproteobacteria bacterium]
MKHNEIKLTDNKPLDRIDRGMIRLLQKDGRMPIVSLAKELEISETTARTRLKRLTTEGTIHVVAVSNPIKLGFEITGNLKLSIDLKKKDAILEKLKAIDQLNYVALTTGGMDIDVEFIARSLGEFKSMIFEKIYQIDGVTSSQTSLIVEIVKDTLDYGTGWD